MPRVAPPRKPKNADVRSREYLTESEVTRLAEAAQAHGRYSHRDACMILLAFRHGLRVSDLIALRWDMVDLDAGLLHVTRLKHGVASSHPLRGPDVRGLRRVKRDAPQSPYVFVSEREAPMTAPTFASCWRGQAAPPGLSSWCIRICCAMRRATSWPMMARTHGRSSITWGTRTCNTRCGIRS